MSSERCLSAKFVLILSLDACYLELHQLKSNPLFLKILKSTCFLIFMSKMHVKCSYGQSPGTINCRKNKDKTYFPTVSLILVFLQFTLSSMLISYNLHWMLCFFPIIYTKSYACFLKFTLSLILVWHKNELILMLVLLENTLIIMLVLLLFTLILMLVLHKNTLILMFVLLENTHKIFCFVFF